MRDLPLTSLRALAAVHREGGVRAGARSLGVTHSTVSRQIRELERIYGVALVAPEGRGLVLTPEGASLADTASRAIGDLETAALRLRERRGRNTVTIATTASVAVRWLLPRLPLFHDAHPGIEVSILTEQRFVDPDGERVDLVVRQSREPRTTLAAEPLMDDTIFPVIAATHPDATRGLDRLPKGAALLHDRDPDTTWARWLEQYPAPDVDPALGPRFTSSDLVIRAAAAGLGYALARDRLVGEDVAAGLVTRPFGARSIPLGTAYWLIRADRPSASARSLDRVTEWIIEEATEHRSTLRLSAD
ncbi:LysR substrate-binding domain-containing protein [Roseibacterium sp. SDUM158017]|uniref:LysR substrate-binding domain-containing protein n=1 Tax=Roseicyclus salinarum TaxID=3036773 RepID=UPI002414FB54|nr:LysR substrate-binding domain-containing protein [Roseibacterium sp. SDUM158017]MDG4647902.1 LysR substrate-binding domain-containing protein [Roseibacterium sp. SDUM158017]